VPSALEQLIELLDVITAPDELMERLQAAVLLLASDSVQLQEKQQAVFAVQYKMLQSWVKRQRVDRVAAAVDVLLSVLGV
jgi:hypothetical protein